METVPVQETQPKQHHNLRWIFVSATVGAIIIALLIIQPWNFPVNAHDVLDKASAAMADVNSFRATYSDLSSGYETMRSEIEFVSPTCYHATYNRVLFITELIVFDGKKYVKGDTTPVNEIVQSVEYTLNKLGENYRSLLADTLSKLEKLPSQVVEGEVCFHYYGKSDPEKLDEVNISGPNITINHEDLIQILNNMRVSVFEYEFWIGKEDSYIRKIKYSMVFSNTFTVTSTALSAFPYVFVYEFYDFNKTIVIEAPLDANGHLLPGWELVE